MGDSSRRRQLYSLTGALFEAPNYVDPDGRLHPRPANNIPLITWPDGRWCHAANRFLREGFERGLSRRNRGGTLSVQASHVSHLIRFCFRNRTDFIDLTDGQFSAFVGELAPPADPRAKKDRDTNTVIAVSRTCLAFLDSVGRHAGRSDFVSASGQIRAERRQFVVRIAGASTQGKTVTYWHHSSIPNADPKKKRHPIATSRIEDMRAAVARISTSSHQRQRRHTILRLLEITGARRGEIAGITVQSVESAFRMEQPMLRVPTLKKRGNKLRYRLVPLSLHDIGFIRQYAEVHRRLVMKRERKGKPDHGLLLVSDVTGEPLAPNTITQEIRLLRIAAGIDERACPHMFRHRFLTKLFVTLVEQYEIATPDAFRKLLLDSEQLKRKMAEWTDHASLRTIDEYIDLAFEEVGDFKRAYDVATATLALDSFSGTIAAELDCVKAGEQPLLILERLECHLARLREDLSRAKTSSSLHQESA